MLSDVCPCDVCRVHPVGGRHCCMARIGWSDPAWPAWLKAAAARFRCRPGRGYIVAAARLQLVKRCFVVTASYPYFAGIRGSVVHFFRAWGNTTHFQNELKETLIDPLKIYVKTYVFVLSKKRNDPFGNAVKLEVKVAKRYKKKL